MPRFFVNNDRVDDTHISIIGDDAHHIARSLRMAVGESIAVCDNSGNEYECRIISFDEDKEVRCEIISAHPSENEPRCHIRVFQALPKGDKLDTIIQKAVECGAAEIIPFQSDNCVVKIKDDVEERKTERRQKIAAEAAKQSRRSIIPKVQRSVKFDDMLAMAMQSKLCLFCFEGDNTIPLGRTIKEMIAREGDIPESVAVIIGSEGGFSLAEAQKARECGMIMTGLGRRILRTETASGFVLACIVCYTELE